MGGSEITIKPYMKGQQDFYRNNNNAYSLRQTIEGCTSVTGPQGRDKFSYSVVDWVVDEAQRQAIMGAKALFQKSASRKNEAFANKLDFLIYDNTLIETECTPPKYAYAPGTLGTPYTTDAGVEMIDYCPAFLVTFETLPEIRPTKGPFPGCNYCVSFTLQETEFFFAGDQQTPPTVNASNFQTVPEDVDPNDNTLAGEFKVV